MHYLSSVYSVTIPLHVSGLLVAHYQEVTMYICDNCYVLYVLVYCQLAWLKWDWVNWQSTKMYNTYQLSHIYIVTSWWWATSKPETCRSIVIEQTEDKQWISLVSLHAYFEMHGQQNIKYLEKTSTYKDCTHEAIKNRLHKGWPHLARCYLLLSRNVEIEMYSSMVLCLLVGLWGDVGTGGGGKGDWKYTAVWFCVCL
jgi:hypothetical protein